MNAGCAIFHGLCKQILQITRLKRLLCQFRTSILNNKRNIRLNIEYYEKWKGNYGKQTKVQHGNLLSLESTENDFKKNFTFVQNVDRNLMHV